MPGDPDDWPALDDPMLLERLRAPDRELMTFIDPFLERLRSTGVAFTGATPEESLEIAAGYPYPRADRPVIVDGAEIVGEGDAPLPGERRYPLIAYGANASPGRLAGKLAGITRTDYRLIPARLHDHDICACPFPTGYGSFPAGIAESPGTVVEVAVLELTLEQLQWVTFTEFGYRPGRLAGAVLELSTGETLNDAHVYLQRTGLYPTAGLPTALAAVPAEGRTFPARTQRELAADFAARILGPGADGDAMLRALLEDPGAFAAEHYDDAFRTAIGRAPSRFVPHPAAR